MCRLCQTTTTGKGPLCSSKRRLSGGRYSKQCVARANGRGEVNMTWSKESIGNSAAVETTPSGNGSRKVPAKYESIRRGRRPTSTRIVARRRSVRIESVRIKYSPKKQLATNHSPDVEQRDPSPSSDSGAESAAPRRPSGASVKRTHAFRRSSRSRRAFKEHGPRIVVLDTDVVSQDTAETSEPRRADAQRQSSRVLQTVDDNLTDDPVANVGNGETTPCIAVDKCLTVSLVHTGQSADICSLSQVQLTLEEENTDDHGDVGPKPVELLESSENKDEIQKVNLDLDATGPKQLVLATMDTENVVLDKCHDIGPNPVAILDTVDGEEKLKSTEKRPSMLKRMLRSGQCAKKTMNRRQLPQSAQRRRARVPMKRMIRRPRKVVVMGDMFSGKSNLISAYCRDKFSTNYIPTLLNTCLTDAKVFGENIELVVVEVVGRDDYARLRKCAYHKMDAIILCYSADNPESLRRIADYWVPELKCHAPKVPFILVATKKDIRDEVLHCEETSSAEEGVVSTTRGQKVAKNIGAHTFLECSARYRDNTRKVFETAAKVALQKSRRKRKMRRNCQNDCIVS